MHAENLLLLPGMMCDARMWQHQIDSLECNIVVPDMTSHDNFEAMATDVLAEAPQEFAVAGLSMGGILAFELYRQAPDRISHLALLDTNPFGETPERQSLRLQQIETALAGGLRELAIDSLKPLYLAASNRDDEALLGRILDMAMDLGPQVFERQSLALRQRADSRHVLREINCPSVVICGKEDTLCPIEYHDYMATNIRNSELVVIDDCGHLSSMEKPRAVSDELLRLLARKPTPGNLYEKQSGQNSHYARR